MKFSANLGFLWQDRPLPEAIHAAAEAGFDAVECHWPYDIPAAETLAALEKTGLKMLGLNTRRGDVAAGENGLAALPGRAREARAGIAEAIDYARAIGASNVHVMAGVADGTKAHAAFVASLSHACALAAPHEITILVEPLNPHDAPGYFLSTTAQALHIIDEVGAPNLKLMFDCYHVQRTEGDLTHRMKTVWPYIGHIQFASVPDRGTPDHGEIDYRHIFREIAKLDYQAPVGAEYKPAGDTGESLDWLHNLAGLAET